MRALLLCLVGLMTASSDIALAEIKLNTKPAVVALAWVLSKPFVTSPIIGASKPHHLADAVAATELKLDARTIAKLEEPYTSKAVAGHG